MNFCRLIITGWSGISVDKLKKYDEFVHVWYAEQLLVINMPSMLWECWLGGRKHIRPARNWVVRCLHSYLSGARCRFAYGPADITATHCLAPGNPDGFWFLDHLLRWPNKPGKNVRPSVHPSIRTSTMKHNAAIIQIVVFVKVNETFTTTWLSSFKVSEVVMWEV